MQEYGLAKDDLFVEILVLMGKQIVGSMEGLTYLPSDLCHLMFRSVILHFYVQIPDHVARPRGAAIVVNVSRV